MIHKLVNVSTSKQIIWHGICLDSFHIICPVDYIAMGFFFQQKLTCPKCAGYPSMWIYNNFATFLHLYVLSWSRNESLILAHSFCTTALSSAAVLADLISLIRSLSRLGVGVVNDLEKIHRLFNSISANELLI